MVWWLNVFFLIGGVWVAGAELPGWAPREHASHAACEEHRAFAERECRLHPLPYDSRWICSPGQPLRSLPRPDEMSC